MSKRRCSDCQHWEAVSEDETYGQCRRYPPTLVDKMVKTAEPGIISPESLFVATWFPVTDMHESCGEWKEKW